MTAAGAQTIVGILYPGELGARVGAALVARGVSVITTLEGRGPGTRRRCRECGAQERSTLADVVREADIVLSLVSPGAADAVARDYADLAALAPPDAIFADLNSVASRLKRDLAARVERAGRSFVDGAINGLAARFSDGGTLFLSGPRALEVAALFGGVTRVQVLGDEAGAAASMKMLLSGLSKGVCALAAELALAAQRQGMLDAVLAAYADIYPEAASLVRRMLPTYAQHAARRAEEMRQLEQTVRDAGVEPLVTAAVRALHERLSAVAWPDGRAPLDVVATLETLAKNDFQALSLPNGSEAAAALCSLKE